MFNGEAIPNQAPSPMIDRGLPPDFVGAPTPRYGNVPGVKPTVGMLTDNPTLLKLESTAQTRNGAPFFQRQNENIAAVYKALEDKAIPDVKASGMQDAINQQTGPLRDSLLQQANLNPQLIPDIESFIFGQMDKPGVRGSNAMSVLNKAKNQLSPADAQSADAYTLKKELGDLLNLKTIAPDELTNSAKNNRRLTTELINTIDSSLNNSTNNGWNQYNNLYKQGMSPIEQGRAFQNILDKFDTSKKILNSDVPMMTPAALRKAIDSETFQNTGKQGYQSIVDPTARARLNDANDVLGSIEKARTGAFAGSGSNTADKFSGLISQVLPGNTSMINTGLTLLNNLSNHAGYKALDNALLNPDKFQQLLNLANKTKSSSKAAKAFKKAVPALIGGAINN